VRYYETPYYLLPDGDMADEGYVIIQKALKDTGKVGVGQFIQRGHGNIVAIKPFGEGLILKVLRHANEIRAAEPFFKEIQDVKVDKEALDLAKELVQRKAGKFDPEPFKDKYTRGGVGADQRQARAGAAPGDTACKRTAASAKKAAKGTARRKSA